MPESLWPSDRAAFARYWDERIVSLDVTEDAKSIAHDLFAPVTAPVWLRAGLPLARILTLDLLPVSVREDYGFEWTPGDERRARRARRAWALLKFVVAITPLRLRSWPARHYLAGLKRPRTL